MRRSVLVQPISGILRQCAFSHDFEKGKPALASVTQLHFSAARSGLVLGAALLACLGAGAAHAQRSDGSISQAVVQPLPPEGVSQLNTALRRLARNSRDVDALIDAGDASLEIDDVEAAIGFFGRAQELSPGNPRVKAGLAGAFVRQQRPIEALRLFDEAQAADGAWLASLFPFGNRCLAIQW